MSPTELKSSLHGIIDRIQNERLLRRLYDFLKASEENEPGKLWNSLTDVQKREVMLSYEESENSEELVDKETVYGEPK